MDGKILCIGCRYLEIDRDFKMTGRGVCCKTGECLEMPMIACDAYARSEIRHIQIPDWYREILTSIQCIYMQELFDGRSVKRIAELHGRTHQSVSTTIRRAKERIHKYRESMLGYVDTDSISSYPDVKMKGGANNETMENTSDQSAGCNEKV